MYNAEWRKARERIAIEDRRDGTHLARTIGALDPELIDAAIRVLANDGFEVVVRIFGLHRRHRVRKPLGSREL